MVSVRSFLLSSTLMVTAMAQTADPLSQFISEAYSVYTEVTQILSSEASAASQASGSSSATTSGSSSPTSSFATSTRPSSAVAAAATTSGTGSGSNSGNGDHNKKLAIILGAVLGALALGLLVLVLLLCCRRRRRRSQASLTARNRALSPGDSEIESWRQHSSNHETTRPNTGVVVGGAAANAPPMAEHPAFRHGREHENPFVPVPPPPRRSAPNSRAGLTDDQPYIHEKSGDTLIDGHHGGLHDGVHHNESHKGEALAAGAAGAAIGAAALHHHHGKHDNEKIGDVMHEPEAQHENRHLLHHQRHEPETLYDEKHDYVKHEPDVIHDEKTGLLPARDSTISRKPVPSNNVRQNEGWPYDAPVAAPIDNEPVNTTDQPLGRRSLDNNGRRSLSRDATRANAVFDQEYSNPSVQNPEHHNHHSAMTGAAGLAAGAAGGAALAHHHHRRSTEGSRSPRRHSLGPTNNRTSDTSESSSGSNGYSDAVAVLPQSGPTGHYIHNRQESAGPYDIPPTPPTRSRRNSPFGNAAPAAAAYSYHNRPVSLERRRDRTPPSVPSRSPHRSRNSDVPNERLSTSPHRYSYPAGSEAIDDEPLPPRGIVGDNGYPHLGLPRRKSGGEYDYQKTGPLGPQTLPRGRDRSSTGQEIGDDNTWRVSSGMPGGWQRDSSRNSVDNSRTNTMVADDTRQSGTFTRSGERDSGISGISGTTMGRSSGPGHRLRLADLRKDEEQLGRPSMDGEWAGNDGYDGYTYHQPQHPGVGQAM